MRNKITALLLAGICTFSLSACGMTKNSATVSESAVKAVSTTSVTEDADAILASDFRHPAFSYKGKVYFLGKFTFGDVLKAGITLSDKDVTSTDYLTSPQESHTLICMSGKDEVDFVVQNKSDEVQSLKDCIVTGILFNTSDFKGIKGLPVGVKFEDLQDNLGTPFRTRQAASDDTTTYICDFAGLWNDTTLSVKVDRATHAVTEVDEYEPKGYVTDASDVTNNQIYDYINMYKSDHADGQPSAALKDDTSDKGYNISSAYTNITFTDAKLLILKKIKDVDSFNNSSAYSGGLRFPDEYVPLSALMIEYKADSEAYSGATGALVVYNPYVDASGKIASAPVITDLTQMTTSTYSSYYDIGVYRDEKNLIDEVITGVKQDYDADDYDLTAKTIGDPEGKESSRKDVSKNITWETISSSSGSQPAESSSASSSNKKATAKDLQTSLALRNTDDPIMTNALIDTDYQMEENKGVYYMQFDLTDATKQLKEGDVLLLKDLTQDKDGNKGVAIEITLVDNYEDTDAKMSCQGPIFMDGKYNALATDKEAILQSVPAE